LGNTPAGVALVARSGLGHEVEVIEQYKYLYDRYADQPLGLENFGKTNSTEEFVIVPRREIAQSEIQRISFTGQVTGGFFNLSFRGKVTTPLQSNATREDVRLALEAINELGIGNVSTLGGPLPGAAIDVYFQGDLANRDVPTLEVLATLTGQDAGAIIENVRGGIEAVEELASIAPRDQRYLQAALDYVRPVTSVVTYQQAPGIQTRVNWQNIYATTTSAEVIRYVTGKVDVPWPSGDNHWIEAAVEHEARRSYVAPSHTYAGFHMVSSLLAYTEVDEASLNYADLDLFTTEYVPNEHIGPFSSYQTTLFEMLRGIQEPLPVSRALAAQVEPLTVTPRSGTSALYINDRYPIEYQNLPNVAPQKRQDDQFWASTERPSSRESDVVDYIEIDMGDVKPVNFITFEVSRKPYSIDLSFDILDQGTEREFRPVTWHPRLPSVTAIGYSPNFLNPWESVVLNITDEEGQTIFTRYLRLAFTKREDEFFKKSNGDLIPFSIEVRNLRIGRVLF